jgi:hypothetical protein
VFIDVCCRLLHDPTGPVLLMLDGHTVHCSKAVKAFAVSTGGRRITFADHHCDHDRPPVDFERVTATAVSLISALVSSLPPTS